MCFPFLPILDLENNITDVKTDSCDDMDRFGTGVALNACDRLHYLGSIISVNKQARGSVQQGQEDKEETTWSVKP
jgi:hypothetical protein